MASSTESEKTPSDETMLSSPKKETRVLTEEGVGNSASADAKASPTKELSASSEKEPEPEPEPDLTIETIIHAWRGYVEESDLDPTDNEISSSTSLSASQIAVLEKMESRVSDCIITLIIEDGLGHNWGGILTICIFLFKTLLACVRGARRNGRYFQTCPEIFGKRLPRCCGKAIEVFYCAEIQGFWFAGPRPGDLSPFFLAEGCGACWGVKDFTTDLNCLMRKYQTWDRELMNKLPLGDPSEELTALLLDDSEIKPVYWGENVNEPYRTSKSHLATFCATEKITIRFPDVKLPESVPPMPPAKPFSFNFGSFDSDSGFDFAKFTPEGNSRGEEIDIIAVRPPAEDKTKASNAELDKVHMNSVQDEVEARIVKKNVEKGLDGRMETSFTELAKAKISLIKDKAEASSVESKTKTTPVSNRMKTISTFEDNLAIQAIEKQATIKTAESQTKVNSVEDQAKADSLEGDKEAPKPETSWAATATQEEIDALMARIDIARAKLASSVATARLVWPERFEMSFPPESSSSESSSSGGDASDSEEEDLDTFIAKLLAAQPALRTQPIGPRQESRIEKYLRLTATPENTSLPDSEEEDDCDDGNQSSTSSDSMPFFDALESLPADEDENGDDESSDSGTEFYDAEEEFFYDAAMDFVKVF